MSNPCFWTVFAFPSSVPGLWSVLRCVALKLQMYSKKNICLFYWAKFEIVYADPPFAKVNLTGKSSAGKKEVSVNIGKNYSGHVSLQFYGYGCL